MSGKMKKSFGRNPLIAVFGAVLLLLAAFAAAVFTVPGKAETAAAEDSYAVDPGAGYHEVEKIPDPGSSTTYWRIRNYSDLTALFSYGEGATVIGLLLNDIVLTDNQAPITSNNSALYPVLDGNGYTITYTVNQNATAYGLFKVNRSTIKNLKVNAVFNNTGNNWGSFSVGGIVGENLGIIENCKVDMTYNLSRQTNVLTYDFLRVGGVAGRQYDDNAAPLSSVKNCTVNMTVIGATGCDTNIGGVVGLATAGDIISCVTMVDYDIPDSRISTIVGGITGYASETGWISYNYASGSISLNKTSAEESDNTHLSAGGISGYSSHRGINANHANVSISVDAGSSSGNILVRGGGLIGHMERGIIDASVAWGDVSVKGAQGSAFVYAGGLVGSTSLNAETLVSDVTISNSRAKGRVDVLAVGLNNYSEQANVYAGGLIGKSFSTVTNCSAEGAVSVFCAENVSPYATFFAGGLIGNHDGTVTSSAASGSVTTGSSVSSTLVGGLIGCMSADIYGSSATGNVTVGSDTAFSQNCSIGSLVGIVYNTHTIEDSHAYGDMSMYIISTVVGGIVGSNNNGSLSLVDCDYSGDMRVTGKYESGAYWYIGGIGGIAGNIYGSINGCASSGAITVDDGSASVGGIAGNINGSINGCASSGAITVDGGNAYVGGVAGNINGSINGCASSGAITANGGSMTVGGIAAQVLGVYSQNIVKSCKANGNITVIGAFASVGGLVGKLAIKMEQCYYYGGTITANGDYLSLGGLVGVINSSEGIITQSLTDSTAEIVSGTGTERKIGGLVGKMESRYVYDSYASIILNCSGEGIVGLGGLIGSASAVNLVRCFQTTDLSAVAGAKGVVGSGTVYDSGVYYSTGNVSDIGTAFDAVTGDPEVFERDGRYDMEQVWYAGYGSYLWPVLRFADSGDLATLPGAYYVGSVSSGTYIYSNGEDKAAGANVYTGIDAENGEGIVYRLNHTDRTAAAIGLLSDKHNEYLQQTNVHIELRSNILIGDESGYTAYRLTSVSKGAFSGLRYVTKVTVADSITEIEEEAFYKLISVTTVSGLAGVKHIGVRAFADSGRLEQIAFGNGLETIGASAFDHSGIRYASFGQGLRSIGDEAFKDTSLLSANFWGDRPETIGSNVFGGMLPDFVIRYSSSGSGWNGIRAWNNQTGWKINYQVEKGDFKVELYGGVSVLNKVDGQYIDDQGIKYTVISDTGPYTVMVGNDSDGSANNSGYKGFNGGRVIIPQQVKLTDDANNLYDVIRISKNAFYGVNTLKSIDIGNNLTQIGTDAFKNCTGLSEIFFRGGMPATDGGADVLTGSANAEVIAFSDKAFENAWAGTWSNKTVFWAQSLENNAAGGITYTAHKESGEATVGSTSGGDNRINSSQFMGTEAVISEYVFYEQNFYRVTSLDRYAFYNNSTVRTIKLPATLTTVWDASLRLCPNLTAISVSDASTSFRTVNGILYNKYVITAANEGEFSDFYTFDPAFAVGEVFSTRLIKAPEAGSITALDFSDNLDVNRLNLVLWIDNYAFAGNKTLRTLNTGNVEIIGASAFEGTAITNLTLGINLTEIGENAFFNCSGLTTVALGKNLESIGDGAFRGCTSLTGFTVAADNAKYASDTRGALYAKIQAGAKLLQYPAGNDAPEYTVLTAGGLSVTEIGLRAFDSARYLNTITIGDGVVSVGYMAMAGCVNLRTLIIGKNVAEIGGYMLSDCVSLTGIEVDPDNGYFVSDENGVLFNIEKTRLIAYPAGAQRISYTVADSVTEIEPFAFSGARSLKRVILPASVTRVGDSAFAECGRLSSAYFKGDAPSHFGKYVFTGTADNFILYYREAAEGWSVNYYGYRTDIYNAITEVPNDVVDAEAYVIIVVDSYGAPISDVYVRFGNLEKKTSALGIVTFTLPAEDTVALYVYDTDDRFHAYDNDAFALDRTMKLTYLTMIDRPWVMGVSVKGIDGTPVRDINSQTANINVSLDNTRDSNAPYGASNPALYETVTIKVDGFCASIYYIGEYRLVQNGTVIYSDNNSGAGIGIGMFTLENIPYYLFIPDAPISVEMDIMDYNGNTLVETLSAELNLNIFVFDKPVVENLIGDGFELESAADVPLFGDLKFSFSGGYKFMKWEISQDTIRLGINLDYSSSDDEDNLQGIMDKVLNETPYYVESDPDESEFTMSLVGYIILRYSKSGIVLESAHVVGTINFTYVYAQTHMVTVIPVRLEVYLSLSATVTLNMYMVYNDDVTDMEIRDSSLELGAGVTLRGGLGFDFASLGIYGKAVLTFKIQIPDFYLESAKLYGELGFFVKVNFKIFKIMYEFPLIQGTWVIYSRTGEQSGYETPFSYRASVAPMFSMANYSLMSAEEEAALNETESEGFDIVTAEGRTVKVYKDNITAGGYDADGYDDYNYAKLVWSEFDGTAWSAPQIIDDNGLTDGEYKLCAVGSDIYMVYSQMKSALNASSEMEDYAAGLEIKIARLSGEGSGWTDITRITDNDTYDMLPRLSADGTRLVWVNNAENNFFGVKESDSGGEYIKTDANSVWTSVYGASGWGAPVCVAKNLTTVTSVAFSGVEAAFILDADCDLTTTDDRSVYKIPVGITDIGTEAALNNYGVTANAGEYLALRVIGNSLYYLSGGKLIDMTGGILMTADKLAEDFTVVYNAGEPYALLLPDVVTYDDGGVGTAVYGIFFDAVSGKWGKPVLVRDFGKDKSVVQCGGYFGGGSFILYALVQDNTDGKTTLFESAVTNRTDLRTESALFDYGLLTAKMLGSEPGFALKVTVTNTGTDTVENVTIKVLNPNGQEIHNENRALGTPLLSGETAELDVDVTVSSLLRGEYKAVVTADGEGDEQSFDNTAVFTPAYGDLVLEAKHVVIGGGNYLLAYVRNDGYLTVSGTIYVFAGAYREDGEITPEEASLYDLEIGALRNGAHKYFLIELDDVEFYKDGGNAGLVTLYAGSDVEEYYTSNNYTSVSVGEIKGGLPAGEAKATAHAVTSTFYRGAPVAIDVIIDGAGQALTGIEYNGETLDGGNYSESSADGIDTVTLSQAWLMTLPAGNHELNFLFGTQSCKIAFKVVAKTYTVTWIIGTMRETRTYGEGAVPAYDGVATKASDGNTQYVFAGWTDGVNEWAANETLPALTADAEYTAKFDETEIEYTVTFYGNGGVFENNEYFYEIKGNYGDVLDMNAVPVKADDTYYSYVFSGWSAEITDTINGNANYYARYSSTPKVYTITFMEGGEVVGSAEVDYDSVISSQVYPTRNGYVFVPSDAPKLMPAWNITVNGGFERGYHNYVFVDHDGTEIEGGSVIHEGTVTPPATDPQRPATDYIRYVFTGWSIDPAAAVTGSVTYRAQYDEIRRYTYAFYDADGTLLDSGREDAGWTIVAPEMPVRPGYICSWDKAVNTLTEDTVIVAVFTAGTYKVIYIMDDKGYDEAEYRTGEIINPLAAPTAPEGKSFSGWDWTAASGMIMPGHDITVEGSFVVNTYTYSFVNYDGTEIAKGSVAHGGTVTPPATDPQRTATDYVRYEFTGWSSDPTTAVTGNITYKAQYREILRYSYAFYDADGDLIKEGREDAGWEIEAPTPPVRKGYISKWNKEFDTLTGDTIIIAVYTSQKSSGCKNIASACAILTLLSAAVFLIKRRTL